MAGEKAERGNAIIFQHLTSKKEPYGQRLACLPPALPVEREVKL